jgi:GATA-binding protein, other eukaryote
MSNAEYAERGGIATLSASSVHHPVSNTNSNTSFWQTATTPNSSSAKIFNSTTEQDSGDSKPQSHAEDLHPQRMTHSTNSGNLDLPESEDLAQNELLRDAVFPAWQDDSAGDGFESPEELQKKDPLGTQIWKLYSRTKTRLPNQERMENLTWRMMAMNLRRREQMQRYASHPFMAAILGLLMSLPVLSKPRKLPLRNRQLLWLLHHYTAVLRSSENQSMRRLRRLMTP